MRGGSTPLPGTYFVYNHCMKDLSLISYHLGGLSLIFLYIFISWAHVYTEKFAYFISVNTGFQNVLHLSIIIDFALLLLALALLYFTRHKTGRNFMLGLGTAVVLTISLVALIVPLFIYIFSQVRLF